MTICLSTTIDFPASEESIGAGQDAVDGIPYSLRPAPVKYKHIRRRADRNRASHIASCVSTESESSIQSAAFSYY